MEFKITEILRDPASGTVLKVRWWAGLSEGALNGVADGVVTLAAVVPGEPFTPFENLDEATVTNWVKQVLGKEFDEIEPSLKDQIARQKTPVLATGLPWSIK